MPKIMQSSLLLPFYSDDDSIEIGVDEAGRGPMFGPVYSAAVILPKSSEYNHSLMKDSKRFSSEKKLLETAKYIKENAIAWGVGVCSEQEIDCLNIRNATHNAMHKAIHQVIEVLNKDTTNIHLLIDGNDFKPYTVIENDCLTQIPNICIEGGDNKYTPIAAASILAKVSRDEYIKSLCDLDPSLDEKYGLNKNKGYGTKKHLDGIKEHGITKYHRKTFGICQNYK